MNSQKAQINPGLDLELIENEPVQGDLLAEEAA